MLFSGGLPVKGRKVDLVIHPRSLISRLMSRLYAITADLISDLQKVCSSGLSKVTHNSSSNCRYAFKRKEKRPPVPKLCRLLSPNAPAESGEGASFLTSFSASLTVETAVALPVFLMCMLFILELGTVYTTAVRYSGALLRTGEEIATAAYASEYGESESVIAAGLTDAFAHARASALAGGDRGIQNKNFLLSTFLEGDDMIHVVMTYRMKSPTGLVRSPWNFFVQHINVRGWTGRKGSAGSSKSSEDGEEKPNVYVTDNGRVYHKDPNCSHIRLSIRKVEASKLEGMRNVYGEKYYSCEHCRARAEGEVYITSDGNRYHNSLDCSGLKRSVHEVTEEEAAGHLRPCSKCGGTH